MAYPESTAERLIEITVEIKPDIEPYEKEIECGCSNDGVLIYGRLNHTTYTLNHEKVIVRNIWGYKCKECGMVVYPTDVGDKLYREIKRARKT